MDSVFVALGRQSLKDRLLLNRIKVSSTADARGRNPPQGNETLATTKPRWSNDTNHGQRHRCY
ncbi:MAG: hypothetical protein CMN94_10260 [Synechococcus sp. EAC657]|nr:hypothetical protein [Synechococcus sp. EAC657]